MRIKYVINTLSIKFPTDEKVKLKTKAKMFLYRIYQGMKLDSVIKFINTDVNSFFMQRKLYN